MADDVSAQSAEGRRRMVNSITSPSAEPAFDLGPVGLLWPAVEELARLLARIGPRQHEGLAQEPVTRLLCPFGAGALEPASSGR